jgi:hypothetical protein
MCMVQTITRGLNFNNVVNTQAANTTVEGLNKLKKNM